MSVAIVDLENVQLTASKPCKGDDGQSATRRAAAPSFAVWRLSLRATDAAFAFMHYDIFLIDSLSKFLQERIDEPRRGEACEPSSALMHDSTCDNALSPQEEGVVDAFVEEARGEGDARHDLRTASLHAPSAAAAWEGSQHCTATGLSREDPLPHSDHGLHSGWCTEFETPKSLTLLAEELLPASLLIQSDYFDDNDDEEEEGDGTADDADADAFEGECDNQLLMMYEDDDADWMALPSHASARTAPAEDCSTGGPGGMRPAEGTGMDARDDGFLFSDHAFNEASLLATGNAAATAMDHSPDLSLEAPRMPPDEAKENFVGLPLEEEAAGPPSGFAVSFATASGKSIAKPTAEQLARARAIMASQEDATDSCIDVRGDEGVLDFGMGRVATSGEGDEAFHSKARPMFATASGKRIQSPSKEALCRARKVMIASDNDDEVLNREAHTPIASFATASGKRIKSPSKEALTKAYKVMIASDDDDEALNREAHTPIASFATASGKRIKSPSKEALTKAYKVINEEENGLAQDTHTLPVASFATASGRRIKSPSKEALTKAYKVMAEQAQEDDPSTKASTSTRPPGRQGASLIESGGEGLRVASRGAMGPPAKGGGGQRGASVARGLFTRKPFAPPSSAMPLPSVGAAAGGRIRTPKAPRFANRFGHWSKEASGAGGELSPVPPKAKAPCHFNIEGLGKGTSSPFPNLGRLLQQAVANQGPTTMYRSQETCCSHPAEAELFLGQRCKRLFHTE